MREHKNVTTIDPIFAEATELLFGGAVDARELWDVVSKQDDGSEVHVRTVGARQPMGYQNKPKRTKAERQRLEARVGLASNAIGIAAGAAALKNAVANPAIKNPGFRNAGPGLKRFVATNRGKYFHGSHLTPSGKRLVRGAAIAGASLQAANVAGDVVANRVLAREARVKKSFEAILSARQAGAITTEQAVARIEQVEKKFFGNKKALRQIEDARMRVAIAANQPKAVRSVLLSTAAASAATAGTYGYRKGKKKGALNVTLPEASKPLKAEPKKEITKSQEFTTTWTGEISKVDEDKRQVFGWCSLSELDGKPVVDLQGDYVPIDEIEKSAYTYVLSSRKGGDMHARDGESPLHTADMIESFVVTPEKLKQMGLPEDSLPLGWWVGFKVNDDKQWELVKKRERTGFSIHGKGSRTSKMLED